MSAALAIVLAPFPLQRPLAFILYALSLLLAVYLIRALAGLEWFAPSTFSNFYWRTRR